MNYLSLFFTENTLGHVFCDWALTKSFNVVSLNMKIMGVARLIMKRLFLIGGTMGVGKTTVCKVLKHELPNSVFLDGDWCWDSSPFQVTEETKTMVLKNIKYLLNSFLSCTAYDNIIFCWVMHEQEIIDELISGLNTENIRVRMISLVCSPESLMRRIRIDVSAGIREADAVERSLSRLPLYEELNTEKFDVSNITAEVAAKRIIETDDEGIQNYC